MKPSFNKGTGQESRTYNRPDTKRCQYHGCPDIAKKVELPAKKNRSPKRMHLCKKHEREIKRIHRENEKFKKETTNYLNR